MLAAFWGTGKAHYWLVKRISLSQSHFLPTTLKDKDLYVQKKSVKNI